MLSKARRIIAKRESVEDHASRFALWGEHRGVTPLG
jgi:hypothetical protein